jgi:pyrroline-5-carboxylate reductase
MTDDQREEFEERAAILEFDAGMTREEAERVAMQMVLGKVKADNERNNGDRV